MPAARASVTTMKSRPKPTASLKRVAPMPLEFTSTFFGIMFVPIISTEAGDEQAHAIELALVRDHLAKRA